MIGLFVFLFFLLFGRRLADLKFGDYIEGNTTLNPGSTG